MILWKQLRIPFLAVTFGSILWVFGKVILLPSTDRHSVTPFIFPEEVPLPGWQPLASHPLVKPINKELIAGRRYQYSQNERVLDIEMRYLGSSTGDVKILMKDYTSLPWSLVLYKKDGIGFYSSLVYQERVYLSACINPEGGTTVTERQFKQSRNRYSVVPSRLLPWLLGQKPLKDTRCLWALLSIPIKDTSPEAASQSLEKVWFSWYEWWQPRFPQH